MQSKPIRMFATVPFGPLPPPKPGAGGLRSAAVTGDAQAQRRKQIPLNMQLTQCLSLPDSGTQTAHPYM